MNRPVLWHFTFSHFAEKARWALDFKGIPHTRVALLPGLHYPRVWWATGQATVPVLILDGTPIADSTRIIAALEVYRPEPPLYPSEPEARRRTLALEEFFDERLGHDLRRAIMYEGFAAKDSGRDAGSALFASGHGEGARRLLRAAAPVMRRFLRWRFDVTAASAERSRARITAALGRIETERGARRYLVGDRFSVADLTAAALLSPLAYPPEFPYRVPMPRPSGQYWEAVRRHPALAWVADMYHRHRGSSAEVSPAEAHAPVRPFDRLRVRGP
jgi:glutathione S-transferase